MVTEGTMYEIYGSGLVGAGVKANAVIGSSDDAERLPDNTIPDAIARISNIVGSPTVSVDKSGNVITLSAIIEVDVAEGEVSTQQEGDNPNYEYTDRSPVQGTITGKTFPVNGVDYTIRQIEYVGATSQLNVNITAASDVVAATFNAMFFRLEDSEGTLQTFRFSVASSTTDTANSRTFTWTRANFWVGTVTNASWEIKTPVATHSYIPATENVDWTLHSDGKGRSGKWVLVPSVSVWANDGNTDVIPPVKLGFTPAQFAKVIDDLRFFISAGYSLYEDATASTASATAYTASNIAGLTYGDSYAAGPREETIFAAVRLPIRAKDRLSAYRLVVGETDGTRVFHAYESNVWTHITDTTTHAYYIVLITDKPSGDSVFVQRLHPAEIDGDVVDFDNIADFVEARFASDSEIKFARATADKPSLDDAFPPANYDPGDIATFITADEKFQFAVLVDGVPTTQANPNRNRLTYDWDLEDNGTILAQGDAVVGNSAVLFDAGYMLRGSGEGDVQLVFDQDEYNRALNLAVDTVMPEHLYARISADTDSALRTDVGAAVYDFAQGGSDTEDNGHTSQVYDARFPTNGFQPTLYPDGLTFGLDFYVENSLSTPLNFLPATSIIPDTTGKRWQILASSDNHNPANSSLVNRQQESMFVSNIGADSASAAFPLGINLVDAPAGIIEVQATIGFRNASTSGFGYSTAQTDTYHDSDAINIGDIIDSTAYRVGDVSTRGEGQLILERELYEGNPAVKVGDVRVYLAKSTASEIVFYWWYDAAAHSKTGYLTLTLTFSAELERTELRPHAQQVAFSQVNIPYRRPASGTEAFIGTDPAAQITREESAALTAPAVIEGSGTFGAVHTTSNRLGDYFTLPVGNYMVVLDSAFEDNNATGGMRASPEAWIEKSTDAGTTWATVLGSRAGTYKKGTPQSRASVHFAASVPIVVSDVTHRYRLRTEFYYQGDGNGVLRTEASLSGDLIISQI